MLVYYAFLLYTDIHDHTCIPEGPMLCWRSLQVCTEGTSWSQSEALCCSAARAQRLEGWKAKLYMAPLKRSIFQSSGSGWVRLNQVVAKSNTWSEDFQLFQPNLDKWNAKLKVATWPCQVGHIGITTSISSSAAFNLRHTSSSAKDGPVALSPWESQVMF